MVRINNIQERESEVLDLIVASYIDESKPISSGYLCAKYNLPYSPATVRNIMVSLERQGLVSNIHTSSGRVPTPEGFRRYIKRMGLDAMCREQALRKNTRLDSAVAIDETFNKALDCLSEETGYTSIIAFSSNDQDGVYFRGTRFILEQPEFSDLSRLRNLFYALEVERDQIHDLLLQYMDERIRVLIGDEIGLNEISDCALMVSGSKDRNCSFSLGLLGPMRMDYKNASRSLYSIKEQLHELVEELL